VPDQRHRSGDPRADRRAEYAEHYARSGDVKAAVDLIAQALELAPGWTFGRLRQAEYLDAAGDRQAAAATYAAIVAEDPADSYGAGLKLAAIGYAPVPVAPPPAFVASLFDHYAERFERALVHKLGYSVPETLSAMIECGGSVPVAAALDLGCGTGLMGERLRPHCTLLHGIDLSEGMLAKARRKRIYDALFRADIASPPDAVRRQGYGLITAADVLIYLGDLSPAFDIANALLAPDGRFAFSVETDESRPAYSLRKNLRYAHATAHVVDLLRDAGFRSIRWQATVLRREAGQDVEGTLFLCSRP
jgi:predicted TPR repeat methyltransferase